MLLEETVDTFVLTRKRWRHGRWRDTHAERVKAVVDLIRPGQDYHDSSATWITHTWAWWTDDNRGLLPNNAVLTQIYNRDDRISSHVEWHVVTYWRRFKPLASPEAEYRGKTHSHPGPGDWSLPATPQMMAYDLYLTEPRVERPYSLCEVLEMLPHPLCARLGADLLNMNTWAEAKEYVDRHTQRDQPRLVVRSVSAYYAVHAARRLARMV